jgi:hypothetical protein
MGSPISIQQKTTKFASNFDNNVNVNVNNEQHVITSTANLNSNPIYNNQQTNQYEIKRIQHETKENKFDSDRDSKHEQHINFDDNYDLDRSVAILIDYGFTDQQALMALNECNFNVQDAINYLIGKNQQYMYMEQANKLIHNIYLIRFI